MTSEDYISNSEARRATLHDYYWRCFNKQQFIEAVAHLTTLSEEALGLAWEGIDHMVELYGIEDPLSAQTQRNEELDQLVHVVDNLAGRLGQIEAHINRPAVIGE
jgi:hypothetical protein